MIGRYLFYNVTHLNIIKTKQEGGTTYYFIHPDVSTEGWWIDSERLKEHFPDLKYVGPYIPFSPIPFLRKYFRFCVD